MNKIFLKIIDVYQKTLSPDHGPHHTVFCRFLPTCSMYTKECFKKYHWTVALCKSVWRVIRCNPLTKHKIDLP